MTKSHLLISVLLLLSVGAFAQQATDVLLRQQYALSYKSPRKWQVTGKYFLYLNENVSRFDKSVLGLEVDYQILQWLEASVEYRYAMDHTLDEHTFRYALEGAYSPGKRSYELKLRTLLEQSLAYFDRDYLAVHPVTHVWRNRVLAAYPIRKKLDVYVAGELYLGWKNKNAVLQQSNYELGLDFQIKRRHNFNLAIQYRDYHLKKSNADVIRLETGYKLNLGYQKPKKKKKKSQTKTVEEKLGE